MTVHKFPVPQSVSCVATVQAFAGSLAHTLSDRVTDELAPSRWAVLLIFAAPGGVQVSSTLTLRMTLLEMSSDPVPLPMLVEKLLTVTLVSSSTDTSPEVSLRVTVLLPFTSVGTALVTRHVTERTLCSSPVVLMLLSPSMSMSCALAPPLPRSPPRARSIQPATLTLYCRTWPCRVG